MTKANCVALLGDSTIDNSAYTEGQPSVALHVQALLSPKWRVVQRAKDGAITQDISEQLVSIPAETSQLVLSVGGNDAILKIDSLDTPVNSTAEALRIFSEILKEFEENYRAAVMACLKFGLPLSVCTIYHGDFPNKDFQRRVVLMLTLFNDVIGRAAGSAGASLIDLRSSCFLPEHFFNQIEPSSIGGRKIAEAIVEKLIVS
jgi:hypothetical protein